MWAGVRARGMLGSGWASWENGRSALSLRGPSDPSPPELAGVTVSGVRNVARAAFCGVWYGSQSAASSAASSAGIGLWRALSRGGFCGSATAAPAGWRGGSVSSNRSMVMLRRLRSELGFRECFAE